MNQKSIIAIAVVVIIIGAAAGYAVMSGMFSKGGSFTYEEFNPDLKEEKLAVLGNANRDTNIDADDVTAINNLIASGDISYSADKAKYGLNYMADANYDGVIDKQDADYVQSMIDGTCKKLYYEALDDQIKSYNVSEKVYLVPIQRTYVRSAVMVSNASANISIVGGTDQAMEDEFKDVIPNFSSLVDVGKSGASTVNDEKISQLATTHSDGNVVVLCGQNNYYCKDYEAKFGDTVQIIRFIAWEGNATTGLLTLAYLLDGVANGPAWQKALEYKAFYHKYSDKIKTEVDKLDESAKKTVVTSYIKGNSNGGAASNYLTTAEDTLRGSNTSDYALTVNGGGKNVNDWFQTGNASTFGGNLTWTREQLAAGVQSNTLDVFIVGVPMYLQKAGDAKTISEQYEEVGDAIIDYLKGYLKYGTKIYLRNYNLTGIPDILDLAIHAKILMDGNATISGISLDDLWSEYLTLYCGTLGNAATCNLQLSQMGSTHYAGVIPAVI